MTALLAIIAGLKGAGGIIAGLGAVSGIAAPFLKKYWKVVAIAAAALVVIGLLFAWKDGAVREARRQERATCNAEKAESREKADTIDMNAAKQATDDHLFELEQERLRTLAAQAQTQEYQDEIKALPDQIRMCRAATDADVRRLLRHH